MKQEHSKQLTALLLMVSGIFFMGYTLYRSYHVAFTFDEFGSLTACKDGLTDIIFMRKWVDANNHLLNILLIKLFSHLPFDSLLLYRLPVLIAHGFFIVFSYAILKKFIAGRFFLITGFLVLNCNPYVLDFFMLARGYGLANCFTLIALYGLFKLFTGRSRPRHLLQSAALSAAAMAVLANFSYLYFFIIICLLVVARNAIAILSGPEAENIPPGPIDFIKKSIIYNFSTASISLALAAIIYIPVKKLIAAKKLFFGGTTGFWQDSVASVIERSFYGREYLPHQVEIIQYIIVLIILLGIAAIRLQCISQRTKKKAPASCTGVTLLLSIFLLLFVLTSANYHVFGTKFLTQRTAQFIIVLLSLFFIFLSDTAAQAVRGSGMKFLARGIFLLLSAAYIFHFIGTVNGQYVLDWKYDAETPALIKDLGQAPLSGRKLRLGGTWRFAPGINFYRDYLHASWLADYRTLDSPNPYDKPNYMEKLQELDYLYIQNIYDPFLAGVEGIELVKEYKISGAKLFRVKRFQ